MKASCGQGIVGSTEKRELSGVEMRNSLSEHGLIPSALSARASCDGGRRLGERIRRGPMKFMLASILRQIGAAQLAFLGLIRPLCFPCLLGLGTPHFDGLVAPKEIPHNDPLEP